ncbi:dentin sialophosphoprotein-like [Calliphora vicina]|uniref:dentin sialophosphoprotein-like n=1 Tax=Calliphora vicina TaxID=7373 RepID=UPI00325B743D
MSESLRGSKSSSSRNNSSSSGNSSHGRNHDSIPHKFSSIVNKVESLINKMNYDKHNHTSRNDADKYTSSHKESKRKAKIKQQDYRHNNRYEHSAALNGSQRTTSIDSLNNLTDVDVDSFDDHDTNDTTTTNTTTTINTSTTNNTNDIYSDSDDAEIAHITGTTSVQVHRRIELDQLTDETIREFNEQCSSLSHDMEFYNSWQNEEELEQATTLKQSQDDIYDDSIQHEFNSCPPNTTIDQQINTKDANNNECSPSEADTQDWLDKLNDEVNDEEQVDNHQECKTETNIPLTHIQQIVNNIAQQQICHLKDLHIKQNLNEIEIDNATIDDCSISLSNSLTNQTAAATNGNVAKTRRSSVASSGSVGRMETILEEPTDCKISVKEILQRFETMNKNEVHSISTISNYHHM